MDDDVQSPEDDNLLPSTSDASSSSGFEWTYAQDATPTWRQQMSRWLVTLNPGRTQREYEKAVSYFFETPGVPQQLDDLTFDLLLAYRGALALRATPHEQRPYASATTHDRQRLAMPAAPALEGAPLEPPRNPSGDASATRESLSPLAPATVNVRLTALRQFLVYCSLAGTLPQLSPDRIRAALRRLSVDRRRPYQILGEQEWDQFLQAAEYPRRMMAAPSLQTPPAAIDAIDTTLADQQPRQARAALPKSRSGLTGERTAERDHALIALALATGLRSVELAGLDLGDLAREWSNGVEEWWLILPDAKTKGQRGGRTLPLAPSLVATLLTYVKSTGRRWDDAKDRATPLFLSQTRRRTLLASGPYLRLSASHIRGIVDRVETQWLALRSQGDQGGSSAMLAGETRQISPHALRHSTAIALLEGSSAAGRPPASVEHVRGWLGHFDIRTTQGYLAHLDARRHRRPFALTPGSPAPVDASQSAPAAPDHAPVPPSGPEINIETYGEEDDRGI